MKKIVTTTLLVAMLIPTAVASASSNPTPTAFQLAPLTVTLDASTSPCENVCSYSWRGYSASNNRLGFTVGYGATLTYIVSKPGIYQFVVTKQVKCSSTSKIYCNSSNTVSINVL